MPRALSLLVPLLAFLAAAPPAPFLGPDGARWAPGPPDERHGAWTGEWTEGRDGAPDSYRFSWYGAWPLEGSGAWALGVEGIHVESPVDDTFGRPVWLGWRTRYEAPSDGSVGGGADAGLRFGLPVREADPFVYGAFARVGGPLGGWAWGAGIGYDAFQGAPPDEHEWTAGLDLYRPGDTAFGVRVEHHARAFTGVDDAVHTDAGAWVRGRAAGGWWLLEALQVIEDDLGGVERVVRLSVGWGP